MVAQRRSAEKSSTPVMVWTWRIALRDHGPHDRDNVIIPTMMIISTWMDKHGFCYPALNAIAAGAQVNERTVRRHIDIAVRLGWLHVNRVHRGGQGWRRNEYRACVPDDVDLTNIDKELRDQTLSDRGDIKKGPDTQMSTPSEKRPDTQMSTRCHDTRERPDISGQRPDISTPTSGHLEHNVRTSGCPLNSSRTLQVNSSREGRSHRSRPLSKSKRKRTGKEKMKHVSDVIVNGSISKLPEKIPECDKAAPDPSKRDITKLIEKVASRMPPDKIAEMYSVSVEEVQAILNDTPGGQPT